MKVFIKLNTSGRTVDELGSIDHLEDIKCIEAFQEIVYVHEIMLKRH